jgi:hypothetical protein
MAERDHDPPSTRDGRRDSAADLTTLVRDRDKAYERRERERTKQAGQVFAQVTALQVGQVKLEGQYSELFSRDAYRQAKLSELEDDVTTLRNDIKGSFDADERAEIMTMVKFLIRMKAVLDVVKWALPVIGIANVVAVVMYLLKVAK